MNHTAITTLAGLLVIVVGLPNLWADRGPTDILSDRADAVVVGEIQSGQQGNSAQIVLSVTRIIKGDLTAGTTIEVSKVASDCLNQGLGETYGLWFLRKLSGQWAFLPSMGSSLHSSCCVPLSKTSSLAATNITAGASTVSDHIAVELVAALQNYTTPSQRFALTSRLLGIGESSVMPGLYRSLRGSPDPELRFIGVVGLLSGSEQAGALAEIANNLDLVQRLTASFFLIPRIGGVRSSDRGVIYSLGRIAASSNANLQLSAAEALMYIHSQETLPFLAQLLDSSDRRTREAAIRGLSRFVDNLPVTTPQNTMNGKALVPQGPAPFRTADTDRYSLSTMSLSHARLSEAEYLQFWKSWWAMMKDKLTAKGQ